MFIKKANSCDKSELSAICKTVHDWLDNYPYYHYKNYNSLTQNGWKSLFESDMEAIFNTPECYIVSSMYKNIPIFLSFFINKWDEDHFGFKMAKTGMVFIPSGVPSEIIKNILQDSLSFFKKIGVKFISSRIQGDNLSAINAFLSQGFEYYENIIWPILDCSNYSADIDSKVILLDDVDKLARVKEIARKCQYQRGHFHCDEGFDKDKVNELYSKWVETSFYSDDLVVLIEDEGIIAGYFVCGIDSRLNKFLGYKYGRLKSLALDSSFRGKKLGMKLFSGTLELLKIVDVITSILGMPRKIILQHSYTRPILFIQIMKKLHCIVG